MLIRNVKSYADLENKKNLQAQMLQIAIDNESTLESRVKDYKNPNKPPPIPPQYKTNAELAQDTQLQQKELINNLTSIAGVNNFLALNVSQAIGQLRDGTANFLKVNKNFPVIKKRLEELGKYALDTDYIVEKIKETLEQIDEGLNLSIAGSTATMVFNQAIGSGAEIPSGQDIAPLLGQLQGLGNDFTTIYNQYQADELAYRQSLAQPQQQQAGGQQAQQPLLPPDPFPTYVSQALARTNNNDSLYGQLISRLYAISNVANSPLTNDPDFIAVMTTIAELCDNSPSRFSLDNIDIIEQMERQLVQKQITKIIKGGAPPTAKIQSIINGLDPADYISAVAEYNSAGAGAVFTLPPTSNFTKSYQNLLNAVKSIKNRPDTLRELRELKDKLDRLLQGVAGLQSKISTLAQTSNQLFKEKDTTRQAIEDFVRAGNRNKNKNAYIQRLVALGLLRRGVPQIITAQGTPYDVADEYAGGVGFGWIKEGRNKPRLITDDELIAAGYPNGRAQYDDFRRMYELLFNYTDTGNGTKTRPVERYTVGNPNTNNTLLQMLDPNIQDMMNKLNTDPAYNPYANQAQRLVPTQGFGLKKGKGYTIYDLGSDIKSFFGGAIPKGYHIMPDGKLMKDSEHKGSGFNKPLKFHSGSGFAEVMKQRSDDTNRAIAQPFIDARSAVNRTGRNAGNAITKFFGGNLGDLSSLIKPDIICPAVYDPVMKNGKWYSNSCEASAYGNGLICPQNHNPVMAKDGKMYGNRCKAQAGGGADENYKVDGMGFMNRKIKIGKGIAVQEQPRYRTFGKYIIHIPYLENDNVLNVKFQSMGSIPSIKPVSIDDNFKEFIMDILNTSQVNQQHYNSLTEAEKAHFHKIVKGAGLSNTLKFKADDNIDDKKDVKRLDILVGQIVAGNDNDKVMKEAKELIKKCVSNGSITRHRGMDLLFQIE